VPGFSGARVLVTTWDWDGGWRAMTPDGGGHTMGGGDGGRDPRWMDAMTLSAPGDGR
jgi:hypothetical protein